MTLAPHCKTWFHPVTETAPGGSAVKAGSQTQGPGRAVCSLPKIRLLSTCLVRDLLPLEHLL